MAENTYHRTKWGGNNPTKQSYKKLNFPTKISYKTILQKLSKKHNNPTKVIINEYVKTSEFFLEKAQIKFLNAILDKISKSIRKPL